MDNIKQIGIILCIIVISFMAGLLPCLIGLEPDNQPEPIPIIIVPYIEPPQPTGYIFITTDIPCSEPYYINPTDSVLEVGEWVHSTAEYKRLLKNQLCGKIIEIDGDILTVCIGGDTEIINKYWVEPWDCVLVMYNPDIGYFCSTELMSVPYNENTTYVTKIYTDRGMYNGIKATNRLCT